MRYRRSEKGVTSIAMALYLLLLLSVISAVFHMAISSGTLKLRSVREILQDHYYLERGVRYAVWNLQQTTPQIMDVDWSPAGESGTIVRVKSVYNADRDYTITVSRNGRTVTTGYKDGLIQSFNYTR